MAKSKPIGVRFNLEKLELIQKEQNLKSPQAVLNFLMDQYGKTPFSLPHSGTNLAYKPENGVLNTQNVKTPVKEELTPPAGLKGIDLAIWRAENKNPR